MYNANFIKVSLCIWKACNRSTSRTHWSVDENNTKDV